MSEKKRRKFSRDEVEMRLSRRRFVLATSGVTMTAIGGPGAGANETDSFTQCSNTQTIFEDLTVKELLAGPNDGGRSLNSILSDAIGRFQDDTRSKLETVTNRPAECDVGSLRSDICYRDFFVTGQKRAIFDQVVDLIDRANREAA